MGRLGGRRTQPQDTVVPKEPSKRSKMSSWHREAALGNDVPAQQSAAVTVQGVRRKRVGSGACGSHVRNSLSFWVVPTSKKRETPVAALWVFGFP